VFKKSVDDEKNNKETNRLLNKELNPEQFDEERQTEINSDNFSSDDSFLVEKGDNYNFLFTEYAPLAFKALRKIEGLSEIEIIK